MTQFLPVHAIVVPFYEVISILAVSWCIENLPAILESWTNVKDYSFQCCFFMMHQCIFVWLILFRTCLLSTIWPFCSCSSSRIELGDVTSHNIKQLKRLNQVIFPVSYNDKFYKDVLEVGELAKLGEKNPFAKNILFLEVSRHIFFSTTDAMESNTIPRHFLFNQCKRTSFYELASYSLHAPA